MDLSILEQGAQAGHLHGDTQNVAGCLMGSPSEGLPGGGEGGVLWAGTLLGLG